MRKVWITAGIILVLIGLGGLTSQGWKFGKPLPSFDKKWTFAANELHNLRIRSDYRVEISFVKSPDGTNNVSLHGQGKEQMIRNVTQTELSGGTLDLDLREPRRKFINFFSFNFTRNAEVLVVSLADGSTVDSLNLQSDSGSTLLKDVSVKTADLSLDSGSISIENLTADRLNARVASGSIKANGIKADTTIHANSGSIALEHMTGPAHLSASSGSVKLYKDDTANTDINVDSGSVYVHLPSSFAGFFDLQADSGSIRAPESKRETKDFVKVRADSGSIKIEQD